MNDKIIGQEIPLFLNHTEIHQFVKQNLDKLPTTYYKQILDILKEMYDNNIGYLDGHSKNFLVDRNSEHVEIIDFEWYEMKFDTILEWDNYKIFSNLNNLINLCNKNSQVKR